MQITERDMPYLMAQSKKYATALAELEKRLEEAAAHGDLRENFQYESTKKEYDPLKKHKENIDALLRQPAMPVLGRTISLGQKVRITNISGYGNYKDIQSEDTKFIMNNKEYPNTFIISNLPQVLGEVGMLQEGFISSLVPLITQVLNKPAGTYTITFPNNDTREYKYEVLED